MRFISLAAAGAVILGLWLGAGLASAEMVGGPKYFSWSEVSSNPSERLPKLDLDYLKNLTNYPNLTLTGDEGSVTILPGDRSAFGPVLPWSQYNRDRATIWGLKMRTFTPVAAKNLEVPKEEKKEEAKPEEKQEEKPWRIEDDYWFNNYLNFRTDERYCMLRYLTERKTGNWVWPRDLLLVRPESMDKIDDFIQAQPLYLKDMMNLPPLSKSVIGYVDMAGHKLIAIDTSLLVAPVIMTWVDQDGKRLEQKVGGYLEVRPYLVDVDKQQARGDTKLVEKKEIDHPTLGKIQYEKFNDREYYIMPVSFGGKTFQYVTKSLEEMERDIDLVRSLPNLRGGDVGNAGWEPLLVYVRLPALESLLQDADTFGDILSVMTSFYYGTKHYVADTLITLPASYLLADDEYDCDSSAKMVINAMRMRGFPTNEAGAPGHGWSTVYFPKQGLVVDVDLTAGNSRIFRGEPDLLGYEPNEDVFKNDVVVETWGSDEIPEYGPERDKYCKDYMGIPRDWLIVGPFDNTDNVALKTREWASRYIRTGRWYLGKDSHVVWKRPFFNKPWGEVNLNSAFPGKEWVSAYALRYVYSPKEQEVVFSFGSDDTAVVWVDNEEVWRNPKHRGLTIGEEHFPVTLKTGWNEIQVMVGQGVGGWSFALTIEDSKGNEVPGLKYSCDPAVYYARYPKLTLNGLNDGDVLKPGQELTFTVQSHDPIALVSWRMIPVMPNPAETPEQELEVSENGEYVVALDPEKRADGDYTIEVNVQDTERRRSTECRRVTVQSGNDGVLPGGFIYRWLILGPFSNEDKKDLTRDEIDTTQVRAAEGQEQAGHKWIRHPYSRFPALANIKMPAIDLTSKYENSSLVSAYALVYVRSDSEREAELRIGSDDRCRVWFNGQQVIEADKLRGAAPDQDSAKVTLKQGWNTVLMKVVQEYGGWGYIARFVDAQGNPIEDLEVSLTPPQ